MDNMIKISKNLNTFAGVARRIFCAAAVIIALCVVALLFIPSQHALWHNANYTLQMGEVHLNLVPDAAFSPATIRLLILGGLIFCIPMSLLVAKCLGIIQRILAPMTQGKPFDSTISDSLRKLSFLTLFLGAIFETGKIVLSALRLHSIDLQALFNPQFVSAVTLDFEFDANFILVFAALYLISHVFHYGEELQQLSDETL